MGAHAGNRHRPAYSGQTRFQYPADVVALFVPREPLEFKPPIRRRRLRPMSGVAGLTARFESAEDFHSRVQIESTFRTPARVRAEKASAVCAKISRIVSRFRTEYDPHKDAEGRKTGDAYKTLFVGSLPRSISELVLRGVFVPFGHVVKIVIPKNRKGLPRGYAFVEFAHERDMKVAYREMKGRPIEGKHVIVDVERGRTVKGWLPNRLDGPHNPAANAAKSKSRRIAA